MSAVAGGNMFDIFKAQILLNQKDNMIYGMIILTIFEIITGFLREIFSWIKKYADEYVKKKFQRRIQEAVMTRVEEKTSELFFERSFGRNDNWDRADAILMHVLKIPATQTVLVVGQLEIVKNQREFAISDKVNFQLLELKVDQNGALEHIVFKLFSDRLSVCELRKYVDELVEEFLIVKKNNLGNKTYYFDHIVEKVNPRMPAPKKVLFSKHPFSTNRTLDNVFHERQDEVKHRVQFFLDRKDWYDQRGVPHTLGLLLHGAPGTGKTSTIKAIASMSQRHIVNINLSAIKTKKQLKKLFYDERLEVCENMENTNSVTEYIIPIDKRIFVIEDIDAIDSDLVLKRTAQNKNTDTITFIEDPSPIRNGAMQFTNEVGGSEDTADLDLSTILNIIDGTLETPGRILIISSNYPEKLDEALIRPGRIDMLIEYKKCNHKVLSDMFASFFETIPDPDVISQVPEYRWTPAEVGQLLFKNFGDPDTALKELVEINPREYFKFSHVSDTPSPVEEEEEILLEQEQEPEPEPETNSDGWEDLPNPNTLTEEEKQRIREQIRAFQVANPEEPVNQEPQPEPEEPVNQPQPEPEEPVNQQPQPEPEEPVNQQPQPEPEEPTAAEIAGQMEAERATAMLDMMSETDIQYLMGGQPISEALNANTHQGTYTLLNTGYAASDTGYAYAGLS